MMKLKTILITFLAIGTVLNFSCTKDNHDSPSVEKIIGTWEITTEVVSTKTTTVTGTETKIENDEKSYSPKNGEYRRYTFNEDGTYFTKYDESQDQEDILGTYTIKGNEISFNNGDVSKANYKINNSILTLKGVVISTTTYQENNVWKSITYEDNYTLTLKRIKE